MSSNSEALELCRSGQCRSCQRFCDKLVEPAKCLEIGCNYAYSYEDELSGRSYMGCMYKVFSVEIDVDILQELEGTGPGFGGVKVANDPLPHCPFNVESAYEGEGEDFDCTNRVFFDCSASTRHNYQIFDLRENLADWLD